MEEGCRRENIRRGHEVEIAIERLFDIVQFSVGRPGDENTADFTGPWRRDLAVDLQPESAGSGNPMLQFRPHDRKPHQRLETQQQNRLAERSNDDIVDAGIQGTPPKCGGRQFCHHDDGNMGGLAAL